MDDGQIHRGRHRGRGMTLVELLLGLAITGMIGAAVAAMLAAVSYGASGDKDLRRAAVQHKAIDARLGNALRYARLVLASYTDADDVRYLLLWTSDARANTSPNRSELRVLRHDPATRELASFTPATPAGGWTEDNDTKYAFNANFAADVVPGIVAGEAEVWATDVAAIAWRFDRHATATPTVAQLQAASLVSYRVTIGPGATETVIVGAAAMRNAP